jgi:hypothetical protein
MGYSRDKDGEVSYFTSTRDEVNIIAIAHQSREPYYWRDRIGDIG